MPRLKFFTGARRRQGKFDVRSPALFAAGHILGATNLPHRMISETTLAPYPKDRLVVVYCGGSHRNAPTGRPCGLPSWDGPSRR
jgi:rhodanese-related sulfurtransferase